MEKFTGEIKKVKDKNGSYVEIPFDVEKVFGQKRVKVKATFDGVQYRGSIVKMGMSLYIIGITKEIREKIKKNPGDLVEVTICKDNDERVVEIPNILIEELDKDKEIKDFFESLSFSMKKKYVSLITSAKREETKEKRLIKIIEKLKNKEKI